MTRRHHTGVHNHQIRAVSPEGRLCAKVIAADEYLPIVGAGNLLHGNAGNLRSAR